jgi:surfeit locus 1 family protein
MMFRPLPGLTIATLIALAILIGLGTWQLQRRTEKHLMLAQIASRQNAAPAPLEILLPTGDYAAFRKATATGHFDNARESYVFSPRSDNDVSRNGFRVITPLTLLGGDTILVDRGWVPKEKRDPGTRPGSQPKDRIEVEGSLRRSSPGSSFTPPPDLPQRIFYARNSETIAKALGLNLKSPLILEAASKSPGGPEPLPSAVNIPDNHLNYALTWYSLALVLIVVYLRFHYTLGRFRFRP